jgi:hypothetical protein
LERQKENTSDALRKVATMLNSTGEGFLSFKSNFIIESEFSQACFSILNVGSLEKVNISELLYPQPSEQKETFIKGINLLFGTADKLKQEMMIYYLRIWGMVLAL